MKTALVTTLTLLLASPIVTTAQQPIYLDPSQPIEKRVEDLIPRLTLPEKASLMGTTAPAIDRLKIPVMNGWNQSLHGIVWTSPTTMFPVNIGMAATWNTALIQQVASVIADEGRAIYNLWPTVSGKTEPGGQGPVGHGHRGRKAAAAQRAGLPLAGDQHQPRPALGPDSRGLRRRSPT